MSLVITILITAILLTVLCLPGCLPVRAACPDADATEVTLAGFVTGLAMVVSALFLSAYIHLKIFWIAWGVLLLTGLIVHRKTLPAGIRSIGLSRGLAWLLLAVALPRIAVSVLAVLPRGFDPTFNLLLVRRVMEVQAVFHNWHPFIDAELNYPLGSHYLLGGISMLTQRPPSEVFSAVLILLSVVLTAQVYGIGRRVSDSPRTGLVAAAIFGMVTVFGSIDYLGWGGVPNLLGICFLFLALQILLYPRPLNGNAVLVLALAFTGIVFVHHHVMLTGGAVFGVLLLYYFRQDRPRAWSMLKAVGISLVLAGIYVLPYALRAGTLPQTGVLQFREPLFTPMRILRSLGWAFSILVLVGIFWRAEKWFHEILLNSGWRTLDLVVLTLIGLFLTFAYGYRFINYWHSGQSVVAFTPSRFLTNATPLLAIYAAQGLCSQLKKNTGLILLLLAAALSNVMVWRELSRPPLTPDERAAFAFIRDRTVADAIVLSNNDWVAYLTERQASKTPLPISEHYRGQMPSVQEVLRHLVNPDSPLSKPYTVIVPVLPGQQLRQAGELLWAGASGLRVVRYRLEPSRPEPPADQPAP